MSYERIRFTFPYEAIKKHGMRIPPPYILEIPCMGDPTAMAKAIRAGDFKLEVARFPDIETVEITDEV